MVSSNRVNACLFFEVISRTMVTKYQEKARCFNTVQKLSANCIDYLEKNNDIILKNV